MVVVKIDRRGIVRRVQNLIRSRGVKQWATQWRKHPFDIDAFDERSDTEFLQALNDHIATHYHKHSGVVFDRKHPSASVIVPAREMRDPTVRFFERQKIGYINFPTSGGDVYKHRANMDRQAQLVSDAIKLWEEKKGMTGLVIDLRQHRGGDIYVFGVALRKLLRGVVQYAFCGIDNKAVVSKRSKAWVVDVGKQGYIEMDQNSAFTTDRLNCAYPVAVLVGPKTASAGEVDAVTFYGKPGVRVFGGPTYGLLSGNEVFYVDNDERIKLVLTGALYASSDGTFHSDERIIPDVLTSTPLSDAKTWLATQTRRPV